MRLKRAYSWFFAAVFSIVGCSIAVAAGRSEAQPSPAAESAVRTSEQMATRVDELIDQMWATDKVEPAAKSADGEFMRRVCLDLNGVIPRVGDVRAFLADDSPTKRVVLIDRLLNSPRYSTHMATTWRNRILPLGVDVERGPQAVALQKWLRARFAKNLRYDNLVGEMLLTLGGDELGPALFYQANDVSPEKLATSTAELFLGVHLHCAQCHDHPTAAWTQRDFWGLAAFFARVRAPEDRNNMMRMSYRLVDANQGDVMLPNSTTVVTPKYPDGDEATDASDHTRRLQLALWLTSPDNKFFSRAAVNWAWSQLFGHGIVESLDDSDAVNNQLLNELADYFVKTDFDLRNLWRTLALTRTYQLSSSGGDATKSPQDFSRMIARPLSPEQLYDSFAILAPLDDAGPQAYGPESSPVAGGLQESALRTDFIRRMRPPPGDPAEYREGTLQALLLMNGKAMADITTSGRSSLLGALEAPFLSDADCVQSLFLAAFARQPSDDEAKTCLAVLTEAKSPGERSKALSDILWALANSTEFAFNQ